MKLSIDKSVRQLRRRIAAIRGQERSLGVVLTMGALHEGHLSLIRYAAQMHDEVLVTIFVNPTQFGPAEDLSRYPRNLTADANLAEEAGASLLFCPLTEEMYPEGEDARVIVPRLSQGLCGKWRPGHFQGVATVVAKFFNLIGEGTYYFGKKDYQQWKVIERLSRDLLFPVEIVGRPTIREKDGLAMSSRNVFLSGEERERAQAIPRALQASLELYRAGCQDPQRYEEAMKRVLSASGLEVEYAELRDSDDLSYISELQPPRPALAVVAARVGETRLIDNLVLEPERSDLVADSSRVGGV